MAKYSDIGMLALIGIGGYIAYVYIVKPTLGQIGQITGAIGTAGNLAGTAFNITSNPIGYSETALSDLFNAAWSATHGPGSINVSTTGDTTTVTTPGRGSGAVTIQNLPNESWTLASGDTVETNNGLYYVNGINTGVHAISGSTFNVAQWIADHKTATQPDSSGYPNVNPFGGTPVPSSTSITVPTQPTQNVVNGVSSNAGAASVAAQYGQNIDPYAQPGSPVWNIQHGIK